MGCGATRVQSLRPEAYKLDSCLIDCAQVGDIAEVRRHLSSGGDPGQWRMAGDDATQTPRRRVCAMHHVSRHPNFDTPSGVEVIALLEPKSPHQAGRARCDPQDGDQRTPLWEAARRCHVLIARELLRLGADPSTSCSADGTAPIHHASMESAFVAVQGLEDGYSVFHHFMTPDAIASQDGLGSTALHYAAYYGNPVALRLLLQVGFADHNATDEHDNTPLDQARRPVKQSGKSEEQVELLQRCKDQCAELLVKWTNVASRSSIGSGPRKSVGSAKSEGSTDGGRRKSGLSRGKTFTKGSPKRGKSMRKISRDRGPLAPGEINQEQDMNMSSPKTTNSGDLHHPKPHAQARRSSKKKSAHMNKTVLPPAPPPAPFQRSKDDSAENLHELTHEERKKKIGSLRDMSKSPRKASNPRKSNASGVAEEKAATGGDEEDLLQLLSEKPAASFPPKGLGSISPRRQSTGKGDDSLVLNQGRRESRGAQRPGSAQPRSSLPGGEQRKRPSSASPSPTRRKK